MRAQIFKPVYPFIYISLVFEYPQKGMMSLSIHQRSDIVDSSK